MRLTLRTLLAYMDGILEPEQAEVLRKKIEESEFAGKLMDRIREVTRRLRLGAPHVEEKGALLNPNTVAEYLDNTLHGDRVPDFEKVCLESDMHLAEVASCHQILTMILGEAAEIQPETRQRMYRLLERLASAGDSEVSGGTSTELSGEAAGAAAEPLRAGPAEPSGGKAAVPEYLREPTPKKRFWVAALVLFLAGFTAMILLGAFGLLEPGKPLARWLGLSGSSESLPSPESGSPAGSSETSPQEAAPSPVQEKLAQPEGVLPKSPQESEKTPTEKAPLPEEVQKMPPSLPGQEKPTTPSEKPQEKEKGPPEAPVVPEEKPQEEKPVVTPEAAKPGPQLLGRLVSDQEVLLRLDTVQKDWWRVAVQGNISSGERLLALPTFRPGIGLSAGATLALVGPTEVELLASSAEEPPGVKILFGGILLSTVGKENLSLRIQVEGLIGMVTLLDPDATAAIAVSRTPIPGNDPINQPYPVKVDIFAPRGRIVWTMAGTPPVQVAPMNFLSVEMVWTGPQPPAGFPWKITTAGPVVLDKLPEWITGDPSNPLDRRASPELRQRIQPDQLARIGLMELLEHRLTEVRSLSARCLDYLGEYQQMVALLNKAEERAAWFETLEVLQAAVARSAESASAVREALVRQYGPQNGDLLYRMLLGYSEAGLKSGEAAALVDRLEHNDLVFRVMSFWNLQKITGKSFYYQPEAPKIKRDPCAKRWRDWLEQLTAGKISLSKEAPRPKETAPKPSEAPGPTAGPPAAETPPPSAPAPKPETPPSP